MKEESANPVEGSLTLNKHDFEVIKWETECKYQAIVQRKWLKVTLLIKHSMDFHTMY